MVKYLVQEEAVHLYLYDFQLSYGEVHHTTLEKDILASPSPEFQPTILEESLFCSLLAVPIALRTTVDTCQYCTRERGITSSSQKTMSSIIIITFLMSCSQSVRLVFWNISRSNRSAVNDFPLPHTPLKMIRYYATSHNTCHIFHYAIPPPSEWRVYMRLQCCVSNLVKCLN